MGINKSSVLKNKCILNDIFDTVYVIHCAENEEGFRNILDMLSST